MSESPTPSAVTETSITINDKDYKIDISKIPYLQAFVQYHAAGQPGAPLVHEGRIRHFDVALKGIQKGFRKCFQSLPAEYDPHSHLGNTYKFLLINVSAGRTIDDIRANLKVAGEDAEQAGKPAHVVKAERRAACNTAYQLLYLMMFHAHENSARAWTGIYKSVLYVVSHRRTFSYSIRRVVRLCYDIGYHSGRGREELDIWIKGWEGYGTPRRASVASGNSSASDGEGNVNDWEGHGIPRRVPEASRVSRTSGDDLDSLFDDSDSSFDDSDSDY